MKLKPFIFSLGAAAFTLGSPTASAIPITITSGNPGNAGTDNVLSNDASLSHSGALVQGNFSGSGAGFIVDFTSASGNNQIEGSGGQATITGLAGNDPFTSLTFGLEGGATFTNAILNPDAIADGTINFSVSYIDAAGSPFLQSFDLDGNGNNFFGIEAGDGARITQITFTSSLDARGFENASQFRLGGFEGPTSVPEGGASAILLGLSAIGVGLFRKCFAKQ